MKWFAFLMVMLASAPAYACPYCAFKDKAGLGSWFILAGMIFIPFIVVGGALIALRWMSSLTTEQENLSVGENRT